PLFSAVGLRRLGALLRLAQARPAAPMPADARRFPPAGDPRGRVVLLSGCANEVLAPEINAATIRLLTRHGIEVVIPEGEGCCGALVHHLGRQDESLDFARRNIDAWMREIE